MNRTAATVTSLGIAALIALCLGGCGGNAGSGAVAATVNGVDILEEDVTAYIEELRTGSGYEDDATWASVLESWDMTAADMRAEAIDRFISDELVRQEASARDVDLDDGYVDSYLEMMATQMGGEEALEAAVQSSGFADLEAYRAYLERGYMYTLVQQEVVGTVTPTDEQLQEAAQTYGATLVGKRSSHILFKFDDDITDDEKAALYAEAEEVLARCRSGEDFAELAAEFSDDSSASSGGDVGWDSVTTFVTAYQDALDALEVGEVSDIVESEYGYHIIKCTEAYTLEDGQTPDYASMPEDLQTEIQDDCISDEANEIFDAWLVEQRAAADVTINDMPAGLSYDVDGSGGADDMDAADAVEATAEDATAEDAADEGTADEGTKE